MTAPTETPSTSTSATCWQALGEIVKLWLAAQLTETRPAGLMLPPEPAVALMVSTSGAKNAVML